MIQPFPPAGESTAVLFYHVGTVEMTDRWNAPRLILPLLPALRHKLPCRRHELIPTARFLQGIEVRQPDRLLIRIGFNGAGKGGEVGHASTSTTSGGLPNVTLHPLVQLLPCVPGGSM